MSLTPTPTRTRTGLILALVSGAQFMIILDLAIVNVALSTIQADVGASQADLQWVVVGYGLTLGGFLLLGGRLADVLGRRAVLIAGLAIFAAASLGAGLSGSLGLLIGFRVVQGLGGALVSPAALSILTTTFAEGPARNRALGIFGAVGGTAATVGIIAGGALTAGPGWPWVFLMNVPVGIALIAGLLLVVPADRRPPRTSFDVAGAVTVTGGLVLIVYAINRSVEHGWLTGSTVALLAGGLVLLALFLFIEWRSAAPLVPLSMFRRRTLTASTLVAALVFGSFLATIYQGTLYLQQVLGYSAIATGVAWLAATLSSLVVAGGLAARLVGRYGPGRVLAAAQLVMATGLLLLSRAPADAAYWRDLFPCFIAIGVGIGASAVAVQVAAFTGVEPAVSGLAGGMLETAREVGGAIGVASLATIAIARSQHVAAGGASGEAAQTAGFDRAALVAAGISVVAAVTAAVALRARPIERATTSAAVDEPSRAA
jgi:EmrB/QacA subfamily drug resistance transporter